MHIKFLKLYEMIKVLKPGFFTTIQDKGRFGFAAIGVPVSGVMDSYSADIANSILNNSLDAAVLEIIFGSCQFQFLHPTFICVSGGDFSPKINQKSIKLNKKISVSEHDVLSFGKINYGARSYLAVSGGIQSEEKLNSKSFYHGITQVTVLKKEMILPTFSSIMEETSSTASIKIDELHFNSTKIKCSKGPEFGLLSAYQQKLLFENTFSISKDISRMGYRLNEEIVNDLPTLLTSSVLPGTVQLTPSGALIILMRDCQVTGGYPRILQLPEKAINILSQKTTNQNFNFLV
ncbi:MAG: biotin-dependent carboxylase-like uncharacterized protein [Polaribacter sp.]|jgi:biotin-dependent carboxylase-like uncharacterized protein